MGPIQGCIQIAREEGEAELDDEEGGTAVRAGRYLSDNIYTDVIVDSEGTGVTLNIDLTPDITARGGVTSTGESSVGVFFERDY